LPSLSPVYRRSSINFGLPKREQPTLCGQYPRHEALPRLFVEHDGRDS
jgi:hypothetical protein